MKRLRTMFGCRHRNIGTPVTVNGKTTVFCRDCKRKVEFDPETLRVGRRAA